VNTPLVPPASPAWFFHRVQGERRLGIALPSGEFVDAGRDDEMALLAEGSLRKAHLEALAEAAAPMTGEPNFDVPVRLPGKILCLGKNYAAHAAELGSAVPEEPFAFAKFADTLIPCRAPVVIPHWLDTRVDHEIELALVLGFADRERMGRKELRRDEAMAVVAGYTVFNDVTARKLQAADLDKKRPWLRAKSLDTFGPIGPWVVPSDALDPADLRIQLGVNGQVRQDARTSQMVVGIADALVFLSRHFTLRPGDIIAMGTPAGVGPVEDGDVMRGEIEKIGVLVNPVRKEAGRRG
jgi:2-keto-4-pentenoate hydratase/2-oxohepta-3-ene-1,7-dioic acid hydratase in catechol pathway